MKQSVAALLLILIIQSFITASLLWPDKESANLRTDQTLWAFSASTVDEIRIGDEFDNEVWLIKSGKQWLLPDLENLPADSVKVRALIQSVSGEQETGAIAHSPAARQRFQVADYYYRRRLTLFSTAQTLSTIYLGTSPGFRKVHARNARQDAIYSITLSTFEAAATSAAWLDPKLLQVRAPIKIETAFYTLSFQSGRWVSGTGGEPDKAELQRLISALKTLQIDGVAGEDMQRELATKEADMMITVQGLTGTVTLELITVNNRHFAYSSEYPLFFRLVAYDFDRLTGIDFRLISGLDG